MIQFMLAEMGTTGSVDGSGRLVIKGRFQQKQVETVLMKYIGQLSSPFPIRILPLILNAFVSSIRDVQDVQVAGHRTYKRKSYLFH